MIKFTAELEPVPFKRVMQNGKRRFNDRRYSDFKDILAHIVRDYLNSFELGEQSLSDEAKEIPAFLDNNNRSEPKITAFLNGIAQGIQAQGNLQQGTLFGSSEPASLMDIIQQAKHIAATNEPIRTSLFSKQGNGDFHGAHTNGVTYINVNSKKPLGKVFWHETLHWMKNNNPKLYQQLVKAAGITDAQRKAYLKETRRTDLKTDDEINEEILCDMMEDTAKRTGLLQSIAGKNRGLIERVIQWLKDTMNKFIDHFRNPSGKLTTKQAQALADEFGRIAKDLVDPNGQKIFRYNRRTHNIELADGRGLNDEVQTKKALADLAKAAWDDKNFNGKVSFTPSKKFRDKAQEIFGHDVTKIFITGSDIRHIKKRHGANENLRGQIDMTPEMIPDIYDVVNDFDVAEQGETDNLGQKAIEVTKNINGGQGYVITAEGGTTKAEIKTALKRRNSQVPNAESPEQNVRNDPVISSDENISQSEGKIKYSIGNEQFKRITHAENQE